MKAILYFIKQTKVIIPYPIHPQQVMTNINLKFEDLRNQPPHLPGGIRSLIKYRHHKFIKFLK